MMRSGVTRIAVAILIFLGTLLLSSSTAHSQDIDLQAQAEALFQSLSVEERIGQLFLVTFEGDRAPIDSAIADLILNYHIGGVALLSENDNLTGYGDATAVPQQARELTANLQRLSILGTSDELPLSDEPPPSPESDPVEKVPIPLIIAVQNDGDALPMLNVVAGFTALPNNMALGATWNPENARRVGEVLGREFEATGINMLLGPSLDVLEGPSPLNMGDLGTHSFGGDPYWVGQMGRSYIEGVHTGSNNRLAVAARSFPGKGSSDRPVDEEVPTVRRSLDQLKQIELAPFFAVSRGAPGSSTTADAFIATHIRYQGLQGNIRATTAPISLDPQALNSLLALEIIDSLRSQIAAYLDKLRKAQSKLSEAGQALQQRNTMLKQFQEQRLMLASQCRAWEASFNNSEAGRKALEAQVSKLRERVEELEWELEETHVSLEDSQHQVVSLQDQLFSQLPKAHALLREAQQRVQELERSGEDTVTDLPAVAEHKLAADM